MLKLASLTQTCGSCPSQWDGVLEDGTPVYIRYRWGFLRVDLNPWTENEREIFGQQIGDEFDGYIGERAMLAIISDVLTPPMQSV